MTIEQMYKLLPKLRMFNPDTEIQEDHTGVIYLVKDHIDVGIIDQRGNVTDFRKEKIVG